MTESEEKVIQAAEIKVKNKHQSAASLRASISTLIGLVRKLDTRLEQKDAFVPKAGHFTIPLDVTAVIDKSGRVELLDNNRVDWTDYVDAGTHRVLHFKS